MHEILQLATYKAAHKQRTGFKLTDKELQEIFWKNLRRYPKDMRVAEMIYTYILSEPACRAIVLQAPPLCMLARDPVVASIFVSLSPVTCLLFHARAQ